MSLYFEIGRIIELPAIQYHCNVLLTDCGWILVDFLRCILCSLNLWGPATRAVCTGRMLSFALLFCTDVLQYNHKFSHKSAVLQKSHCGKAGWLYKLCCSRTVSINLLWLFVQNQRRTEKKNHNINKALEAFIQIWRIQQLHPIQEIELNMLSYENYFQGAKLKTQYISKRHWF